MDEVSSFTEGHLTGQSYSSASVQDLLDGYFDLALVVSSWDARCQCIQDAVNLRVAHAILVLFEARDAKGCRDSHDRALEDFCRGHCGFPHVICCSSLDIDGTWTMLDREIGLVAKSMKRPLTILLDISTCPRYYALAVLGSCITRRLASVITVFYAEGKYPPKGRTEEMYFTGGRWRTVPVPFFHGIYRPGDKRFYLVSVGFEGNRTLRSVSKADPDRVSMLFPCPGVVPAYVTRARQANKDLRATYHVPSNQIVKAHVGDAIGGWKALSEAHLERANENVYYMCAGSKPHALSLGLRALSLGHPALLYNVPDEHLAVETVPFGRYWKYEIEDFTAPMI